MTRRRMMRVTMGVAAVVAVSAGCLVAGWTRHTPPVPILAAVTLPATAVARTPCTATARACVDLTTRHAWLIRNGRILVGPVPISTGGPGEQTPIGTFKVWRKDPHHISMEQHGTPMPYSVFFDRGVAFHSGPLALMSAGCVHLRANDAITFYNNLRIGDQVQVRATPPGSQRLPVRPTRPPARLRPTPAQPGAVPWAGRDHAAVAGPGVHILPVGSPPPHQLP